MSDPEIVLAVEDLQVGFGDRLVIDGVSLGIREREIFVIMGPSGCGKTTLLKTMVGLLRPRSGRVRYRGETLSTEADFVSYRHHIGMVFQYGALLNSVSLEENVALPLREHTALPDWMIRHVVHMKLAQVGLLAARKRMPMELSGGMRKRAGIARAIALEPDLLFFDEPSGGLDPITADGIDNLVLALREQLAVTIVVVTHEIASIFKVADRVMMLAGGKIAALGDREEVRATSEPSVSNFISRRAPVESGAADEFLSEVEGDGA